MVWFLLIVQQAVERMLDPWHALALSLFVAALRAQSPQVACVTAVWLAWLLTS